MKGTPNNLKRLEQLVKEAGLRLVYDKGNFKSGYCLLEDQKTLVINKFLTVDTKVSTLVELMQNLNFSEEHLSNESKLVYKELQQTKIKL